MLVRPLELTSRYHQSFSRGLPLYPDVPINETQTNDFECGFQPEQLDACLLDENNDTLDSREYDLRWTQYSPDLSIETPSLVDELLKRGENENVEFKKELCPALLGTVTSFANTDGGVILVSVEDDTKIIGIQDTLEKVKDRLTSMISANIIPQQIKCEVQKISTDTGDSSRPENIKSIFMIRVFRVRTGLTIIEIKEY